MANTSVVAFSVTYLALLIASQAAFALAKLDIFGKTVLFGIVLAILLLPSQFATTPQFLLTSGLVWVGELKALIFPGLASAFGIFRLPQYANWAFPKELLEEAN